MHARRRSHTDTSTAAAELHRLAGELHEGLLEGAALPGQLVQCDAVGGGQVTDLFHRCFGDAQRVGHLGGLDAGGRQNRGELRQLGRPHLHRGRGGLGDEVLGGGVGHQLAAADHQQVVGRHRHLREQVRRHEDGAALGGQALHEGPDPQDALGVETVDGLVEQQDLRVAEQGAGQAETLLHAERELAGRLVRDGGQADQVEHLVDPLARQLVRRGEPAQVRLGAPVRVDPVGVEQGAHLAQRMRQLVVAHSVDEHAAAGGVVEAEDHPHGGRFARAIGPEETGHQTGVHGERQIVHRDRVAELLRQFDGFDHLASRWRLLFQDKVGLRCAIQAWPIGTPKPTPGCPHSTPIRPRTGPECASADRVVGPPGLVLAGGSDHPGDDQ